MQAQLQNAIVRMAVEPKRISIDLHAMWLHRQHAVMQPQDASAAVAAPTPEQCSNVDVGDARHTNRASAYQHDAPALVKQAEHAHQEGSLAEQVDAPAEQPAWDEIADMKANMQALQRRMAAELLRALVEGGWFLVHTAEGASLQLLWYDMPTRSICLRPRAGADASDLHRIAPDDVQYVQPGTGPARDWPRGPSQAGPQVCMLQLLSMLLGL